MTDNDHLVIRQERFDGGIVLMPIGDIDLSRSPDLLAEITAISKQHPQRLIVDLAEVDYMDSSGVAVLVLAYKLLTGGGSRLILCGMKDKVRAIFEIARLDTVLTIVSDTATARTLEHFTR